MNKLKIIEQNTRVMSNTNGNTKKFVQPSPNRLNPRTPEALKIIEEWRVGKHDKGSIDVEIGFLSDKISKLENCLTVLSNQSSRTEFYRLRKILIEALNNRQKKLDYLMNTNTYRYRKALDRLQKRA